ncbi:MAG: TolC family protein, partial [Pseudomonadota bacterium]
SAYLFKTIDQRKLPPDINFNYPGWFQNYEIGLKASINIFNGGRDLLTKRMAETGLQIHELDRQTVENALAAVGRALGFWARYAQEERAE